MRSGDRQNDSIMTRTESVAADSRVSSLGRDNGIETNMRVSTVAYDELADVPVQNIDPVEMVERNLTHLSELQSRLKFMMKEIRYILKV